MRRLALRSLRTVDARRPRRPRPDPAGASRCPQAARDPRAPSARPRSSRPAATWRSRCCWPPRRSHPGRAVGRQRHPRPRVRATARLADGARGVVRGDLRRARRRGAERAVLRDRDADPRHRATSTARRRARGSTSRPATACSSSSAARRPSAGSTRAVAEALAAARRARHRHPRHRRRRATPRRSRDREALPDRPARRATGRTRSCATRCWPRSPPRTWSSAGPARRRWPR